jgi:hypothetical protein
VVGDRARAAARLQPPVAHELGARTERVGLWLETSNQSAEQTVAEILSRKTEAELSKTEAELN